jgi:hypothetical protein
MHPQDRHHSIDDGPSQNGTGPSETVARLSTSSMIARPPWLVLLIVTAVSSTTSADVIRLKSGGEVRGKVDAARAPANARARSALVGNTPPVPVVPPAARSAEPTSSASDELASADGEAVMTITTLSGARVVLAKEEISLVALRRLVLEEYEVRARHAAPTVESLWALAEWCRDNHLKAERDRHLRELVAVEPDHQLARTALGDVWRDGGWVNLDEYMSARGYVKHRGKYITQQEYDLAAKSADERSREQAWFPKIKLWTGWLSSSKPGRAGQALSELRSIQDADAAPAIARLMSTHEAREVRELAVQILASSAGEKPAEVLAKVALADGDGAVRQAAINGLPDEQFELARKVFGDHLRHPHRTAILRAAVGLKRVGDASSVEPLIAALVTTHRDQVVMPGSSTPSYSFATNGQYQISPGSLPPAVELGLLTGNFIPGTTFVIPPEPQQKQVVTILKDYQNPEVLDALRALTAQDFGYDERLWTLWWQSQQAIGQLPPT